VAPITLLPERKKIIADRTQSHDSQACGLGFRDRTRSGGRIDPLQASNCQCHVVCRLSCVSGEFVEFR
jgi:hypothetical protein